METKSFKVEFKEINEAGEFVAYISTKSIDSYNDKVLPTAFKRTIDHNKGTFPILWMHDASKPIGVSTHMVMDDGGVKAYGKINLETELGKEVYSGMKFSPPYIDRTSIGFVSVDDEFNSKTNIRTIKELKLLEFSLITRNFAANSEALVANVKSNNSLEHRIKKIENILNESKADEEVMSEDAKEDDVREMLSALSERVEALARYVDMDEEDDSEEEQELEKDPNKLKSWADSSETLGLAWEESLWDTFLMEEKAVSGDTSLPLASKDHAWSGPEAKKRIFAWAGGDDFDPSKVKKAFFYYDAENDKLKSSYKLPFADVVDGKLMAIPRALSAVQGALDGARGTGVDIPDSDKDGIMKKVDSYQNRIDKMDKYLDVHAIILELKNMNEELE